MEDAIEKFPTQFDWHPAIEQSRQFGPFERYIVCGMGGSALGAWIVQSYGASPQIVIHRDYGLPRYSDDQLKKSLIILSSYSGDTEEVLDAASEAITRGLTIAILTTGGALLKLAKDHNIPYVQMPDVGIPPRMAIGLSMIGIARLMNDTDLEERIRQAGLSIQPKLNRAEAGQLAIALRGKIPLVYASESNAVLAYLWKIKFNENAKIPAFFDTFPELCHNELSGYDIADSTRALSGAFHLIFLSDDTDHMRIQKRMDITAHMLGARGIPVTYINVLGEESNIGRQGFEKAFYAALYADWVTLDMAQYYQVPDAQLTPLIAEFKKKMTE